MTHVWLEAESKTITGLYVLMSVIFGLVGPREKSLSPVELERSGLVSVCCQNSKKRTGMLSPYEIRRMVDSMAQRVQEVLAVEGGHTRWQNTRYVSLVMQGKVLGC